jgi:hypothetical protein
MMRSPCSPRSDSSQLNVHGRRLSASPDHQQATVQPVLIGGENVGHHCERQPGLLQQALEHPVVAGGDDDPRACHARQEAVGLGWHEAGALLLQHRGETAQEGTPLSPEDQQQVFGGCRQRIALVESHAGLQAGRLDQRADQPEGT